MDDPQGLAIALQQAAKDLIADDSVRDLERTVAHLVQMAVETVPGATAGGISRLQGREVLSSHATHELVDEIDAIQTRIEQGPCLTAAREPPADGIIYAADLSGQHDADRWPAFAPQAVALGFRSLVAVGLWSGHQRYAALNLYAEGPHAFDREARLIASLFGAQAATLLYGAESAAGLDRALGTRDTIGQAKGILMERFGLGPERAFRQLVKASQDTNMKLTAVAEWVTQEVAARDRFADPSAATTDPGGGLPVDPDPDIGRGDDLDPGMRGHAAVPPP